MQNRNMSQNQLISRHLRLTGPLTPLEAMGLYSVFRLAARIKELRDAGLPITTTIKRDVHGKPYASYSVPKGTRHESELRAAVA